MIETAAKRLVITADTSSLPKAANDVQKLGTEAGKTSSILAAAKGSMPTAEYKALAASLAPAIAAEKALAVQVREVERALKPMLAEQRKITAEHMKAEAALTKRTLTEQKAANALRMRHDIEFRNAQTMMKVETDVARHIEARNLTIEQGNAILAGAATRYRQMGQQAQAANQNVRLTSFQMTNLGYQANDVATMMLMGASPFQIMASQAGQVVQALGDNPQGVGGSLRAIGSSIAGFARAIPTAAYAVAGVTAAVGGLYALTRGPSARSAEESVATFEEAVQSLRGAWDQAGHAAEEHYRRATAAAASNPIDAMLDSQADARKLRSDYQAAIRDLNWDDSLPEQILRARTNLSPLHREIGELYGDLLRGEITAGDMANRMREIRLDEDAPGYVRSFADAIRIALGHAIDLENRIDGVAAGARALTGRGGRVLGSTEASPFDLRDRFGGGVTEPYGRLNPEGMDAIRNGLRGQAEELRDADSAARDYAKSLADLRSGWDDSADDLRRQIELFGQSEGAIAAARFEHEALAEARRMAADAGKLFDENGADAARIRDVAAEIGTLTEQMKGLRDAEDRAKRVRDVLRDLEFQSSLIGLPEIDASIARQLNSLKVEAGSYEGRSIEARMLLNDEMQKTNDALEKQRDLMSNVVSTGFDALFDTGAADSFFDRIIGGLADIGRQFAEIGKAQLMERLFGSAAGYTSGFPAPGQRTVAPVGVPLASNDRGGSLNLRAVTALNDNLQQSSRSALDVAKQFDGLNERADSRVLDSFLQASGTWKGMSARDFAWCASFANAALIESGQRGTNSNMASSFMNWGQGTNAPKPGDIVVFRPQARGTSGHVSFFEGFDANGNVRAFGGNQSGMARTSTYAASEVRAFRTATRDGYVDAVRQITTGQAALPSSVPIPTARPIGGAGGNGMAGVLGAGGSNMLGGLLGAGIFASGMQSGSVLGGGFSGLMGGQQLGAMLGIGGPAGMVVGGILGVVGSMHGRRAIRHQPEGVAA